MDTKIEKPKSKKRLKVAMGLFGTSTAMIALYSMQALSIPSSTQSVPFNSISISTVKQGSFTNNLPLRGQVEPRKTIYLDVKSGGVIEEVFVEPGTSVEAGTPIARLSNTDLQLQVISREAQVTEQLNFLRNTEMEMETSRLNIKRDIIELEFQVTQLQRKLAHTEKLAKKGLVSREELTERQDELVYYKKQLALSLERQKADEKIRSVQREQLESGKQMLERNLEYARLNLENLVIKSPTSGYLSQLDAEIGESKVSGSRLGQIDLPNDNILSVRVDEYYLNIIQKGMQANIDVAGKKYTTQVSKIDSQVDNSQFYIEVDIPTGVENIKRGQTLDVELVIGDENKNAMLLKRGAFFSDTGGNWVFVLNDDNTAERRKIKISGKDKSNFQIKDGLRNGEKVITSSYAHFNSAEKLILK
ncbi:HlyD family efflux transporter periplasmic adaptor subunit [Pseudoalteromonas sp. S4498]|uniref:efflux RND transporter periplasmic adaptor subunit n=1 Tax=Pseudoalteromonas TaxID=53246 RepID=UPI00110918E7|nr:MULTISPECIES: HlyD family efflux transporter periplasmic adaptor subunit [Pseudoalteromonas]MCG9761729.1 HlyD family efflux transporter periplasmic adaptor subunit [Pseudoalteromonas sp. Isolate6]NKC20412.1 HlyD family efflux transporter periplasmic adaptor subunit [Pseudoalteromonas galatheae]